MDPGFFPQPQRTSGAPPSGSSVPLAPPLTLVPAPGIDPQLEAIVRRFPELKYTPLRTSIPLREGSANATFLVHTSGGALVVQELNDVVSDDAVAQGARINSELAKRGWQVPQYLISESGGHTTTLPCGKRARVWKFIEGETFAAVADRANVRSLGYTLGRFHAELAAIGQKADRHIPHFHETDHHMIKLVLHSESLTGAGLQPVVSSVMEEYETRKDSLVKAEREFLLHGDARVGNFLYHLDGRAFTLIDPDNYMMGGAVIDLGDLANSLAYAWRVGGSAPANLTDAFTDLAHGYAAGGNLMTAEEAFEATVRGFKLITLEFIARLLVDVAEDRIFAWGSARFVSRAAHNKDRALRHWRMYLEEVPKLPIV